MAYKRVMEWDGEWYRPEYIPFCDICERQICGRYAVDKESRLICEECVEDERLDEEEERLEWRLE